MAKLMVHLIVYGKLMIHLMVYG